MGEKFFTSDTHFFHKRILHFCPDTRQGKDEEEMTELMIESFNKRVKPQDDVYHLGDFSFAKKEKTIEITKRLNGRWNLIRGNHDADWLRTMKFFQTVKAYDTMRLNGRLWVLCHFPIESWDEMKYNAIHIHGHLHGDDHHTCRIMNNRFDVGVDCRIEKDMGPFHYDEVIERIRIQNESLMAKNDVG